MKSWGLFLHTLRMVFDNLETALRVTGALFFVQLLPQFYLFLNPITDANGAVTPASSSGIFVLLLLALVSIVCGVWMAVVWHRYVLTGEQAAGFVPQWQGKLVLGYLGRFILVGLLALAAGLVFSTGAGILLFIFAPLGFMAIFFAFVGMIFVSLRFSLILPAVAMGKNMKLNASWQITGADAKTVLGFAAILVGFLLVLQIPGLILSSISPFLALIGAVVIGWVSSLVSITALTTMYGVYVEGRAID